MFGLVHTCLVLQYFWKTILGTRQNGCLSFTNFAPLISYDAQSLSILLHDFESLTKVIGNKYAVNPIFSTLHTFLPSRLFKRFCVHLFLLESFKNIDGSTRIVP